MDDDEREAITEARISGTSTRALAKRHNCSNGDIEEAVDRQLSYELNDRQRLRLVKLSLGRIETLISPFFERAVREKDVSAGMLVCKLEERLALLLGLDHPTQARVDVYAVEREQQPSSHERIKAAIMGLIEQEPPAKREAHDLVNKIGGERALELLKAGSGNGNGGGADVRSLPDARNGGSEPQ